MKSLVIGIEAFLMSLMYFFSTQTLYIDPNGLRKEEYIRSRFYRETINFDYIYVNVHRYKYLHMYYNVLIIAGYCPGKRPGVVAS